MKQPTGRNELCPCGSGRKYKNCCAGKSRPFGQNLFGARTLIVAALVGTAIAGFAMIRAGNRANDRGDTASTSTALPPGERPSPWAYDSVANQHFDPGHGHWHAGPPPGRQGAPAPGSAATTGTQSQTQSPVPAATQMPGAPAPWTYDGEKNQHWDPNHQHWHQGPPPPGR